MIHQRLIRLIIVVIIFTPLFIWSFTTAKQVFAQELPTTGLAVSPPIFELSANPGDTLKNTLRLDNTTDSPIDITVSKRNFRSIGEEGGIDLSDQESAYSLANWIEVTPGTATLGPHESKTFDYTIAVPKNAEPGGRFASIVFQTKAKQVSGQNGVAIVPEIGTLIFIKISGEVKEQASITSFDTHHDLNDSGPVNFDLRIKNEGNVQFKPTGTITISNFFGEKIATIPIDAQNVLPESTRKMTAEWDQFWLFGKYQATLSVVYGNGNQMITATTDFWGFPYKLVGITIFVIALVGLALYPRRRRILRALKVLFGKE